MRAPTRAGFFAERFEIIDAVACFGWGAERFFQPMRCGVQAAREALGVGGGCVEDAQQRLVSFSQRPSGAEVERRLGVNPWAILAKHWRVTHTFAARV